MKLRNFTLFFSLALLIMGCMTKVPMNPSFYNQKRVGVITNVDSINTFRAGPQGLLDMALTGSSKYKKGLKYVESQINTRKLFKLEIKKQLDKKNKSFRFINDNVDLKSFPKFDNSNQKYYSRNLASLKQKYNIDELLIFNVKYGLEIEYYSMIEIGKKGSCDVHIELINLNDNSFLYKDYFSEKEKIKGKWNTPPHYENLKNSVETTIHKSINKLEEKF